jgi:hypothetical protein
MDKVLDMNPEGRRQSTSKSNISAYFDDQPCNKIEKERERGQTKRERGKAQRCRKRGLKPR